MVDTIEFRCPCCDVVLRVDIYKMKAISWDYKVRQLGFSSSKCSHADEFKTIASNGKVYCKRCGKEV